MDKWECSNCGYIYDPEEGDPENDIEPGTDFDDLPDDWVCPDCDSGQEQFDPIQNDYGDDDDDEDEDYDEDEDEDDED